MSDPRALSRAHAWALTFTATFTMAVSYLDRQTLAVIAPTVQAELHISDEGYGWLVSAFAVAYLVGAPLAGRLVDRIGARRGLLGAVFLWSGVAALHALAPGFGALFALRIALGLAEAPSFPGAAQSIHRALPPADRARGMGLLFSGSSFGAMVAPPLATYLTAHYGFRFAFLRTALIGLSWMPLWLLVPRTPSARAALDRAVYTQAHGAESRVSMLVLTRHPAVLRALAVVAASAPFLSLTFNWSAKFLVHDLHLSQVDVGRYLWLPPVLFDAGAILFGHFASRAAAKGDVVATRRLFVAAALIMLFGALVPFTSGPLPAVLLESVALAGGGGLYTLATGEMLTQVPQNGVSTASGISAAMQSVTHIIVNPLIGSSITATGSYTVAFMALSLWVLPGCAAWLFWQPSVEAARG